MNKRITVYCASSMGCKEIFADQAYAMGQEMVKNNFDLVYGGANIGLMGAVANGVLDKNGNVIGVIPKFLKKLEIEHPNITECHSVENMHERKTIMSDLGDAFIIMAGGFGTMEEFFEIITWKQLSLHNKPIGILNVDNYFDSLLKFINDMSQKKFIKETDLNSFIVESDPKVMIQKIKEQLNKD